MDSSSRRGLAAMILGLALLALGAFFEGLLRGLFEGAAIALVLLGVFTLSRARRQHGWLPSRDGDQP